MTEKTGRIIIRLDGGVICIGENNKQSWRGSSVGRATKKWSLVGDSYSNDFKLGKPFVIGSNPTLSLDWLSSVVRAQDIKSESCIRFLQQYF